MKVRISAIIVVITMAILIGILAWVNYGSNGQEMDQREFNYENKLNDNSFRIPDQNDLRIPDADSGFCGFSTQDNCSTDSDCIKSGCSGQVCMGKNNADGGITTCEFQECYDAARFNLTCGCQDKKCQWK